jgi:hypothetical protein
LQDEALAAEEARARLLLKKTDSSTPASEARKPDFWTTMGRAGSISTARMEPGNREAKAIRPGPPGAV